MFPVLQVLILGSGGLHIGQAGEFDYSGTQVTLIGLGMVVTPRARDGEGAPGLGVGSHLGLGMVREPQA